MTSVVIKTDRVGTEKTKNSELGAAWKTRQMWRERGDGTADGSGREVGDGRPAKKRTRHTR